MPPLPLMEDVALARQLKGHLLPLDATAFTSAERYEKRGWARQTARDFITLARYFAGTSPERLAQSYQSD